MSLESSLRPWTRSFRLVVPGMLEPGGAPATVGFASITMMLFFCDGFLKTTF